MTGFVIWMTGLSGSGKSTLASLLTTELTARGVHVESLDGDEVRKNLSHGLGFAREDRDRNVRRIGYVARMVARSGSCAITAAISPYRAMRDEIRSKTENFIEVYCECPLEVLTERDPKGLYRQALAGEIKNFTGVDDPYEAPLQPEVHVRTDLLTPEQCVAQIIQALDGRGLLGNDASAVSLPPAFGGEVFEARTLGQSELQAGQPSVEISVPQAELLEFVARGFTSPLAGFMTMREAHKVKKQGALERGTPWWTEPFLLPLPADHSFQSGQTGSLTRQGAVVARITVEEIWQDGGVDYAAGSIDAVVASPSPTARGIRRGLVQNKQSAPTCLFITAEPSQAFLDKLEFGATIAASVVLGIASPVAAQWWLALTERGLSILWFDVPTSIPMNDDRALAVMAKSVGAARFLRV